jgi:hypothetical protein
MSGLSYLQIRTPKEDETPIEATTQIFSSLLPSSTKWWKVIFKKQIGYSFEIYLLGQRIYFYVTTPTSKETFVKSLLASSFPSSAVVKTKDPLDYVLKSPYVATGDAILTGNFYLPIKTFSEFKGVDPLASLVGFLAKGSTQQKAVIQILLTPATFPWQKQANKLANPAPTAEGEKPAPVSGRALIGQKTAYQGGKALVRLLVGSEGPEAATFMEHLMGTFGAFAMGEGNQFKLKKPRDKKSFVIRVKERSTNFFEYRGQILNSAELTTLWHPPGILLAGVKNIAWGKTLAGEPPENIPIPDNMSDEDKKDVNFFARTEYKNKDQIFGIKTYDRRKHVYIIGKTGAGKSTLIANMAIDDIRRDRGIGIIDPHGDLTEAVLDYVPKRRINDIVYLEPFDLERPFHLNILQVPNPEQKHLVASGIVSIFYKLYGDVSWGPRLEYILRNLVLTLLDIPNATLPDALRILADDKYRARALEDVRDPVVMAFWKKEFDKMPDRMKAEAVSPLQNKIGQFVTAPMIRNIIGSPKSTIDLAEIMDERKILLLNLSQGKLGEDNAALLGAMFITQLQLAAMNRAFKKEEERQDFFLYVDEFQNFATSSFIKILSEARKYRLALTLANQYIDQLDEDVSRAIFGNAGTLVSFLVGARDADPLSKEFGGIYSDKDLVSLGKFEVVLKLSVDGQTSQPFPARTLPPPSLKNDNREKIVRLSKEKYGRAVAPTDTISTRSHPIAEPTSGPQKTQEPHKPQNSTNIDHIVRAHEEKSSQQHQDRPRQGGGHGGGGGQNKSRSNNNRPRSQNSQRSSSRSR